jgi:tRNA G18 (ribose-2'-O)-methylase SpoU
MGSLFARPPARATLGELPARTIGLVPRSGPTLGEVEWRPPEAICLGGERTGLPDDAVERMDAVAHIPLREGAPDSLNVAMAATVALYERNRMAADA